MTRTDAEKVAAIVRDAGGEIIGRTRLQKTAYLLDAAGFLEGFSFSYKHYGPYSEELAEAARLAGLFDLLEENEKEASWGGTYSIYSNPSQSDSGAKHERLDFAKKAANANAIELELAATALFLAKEEQATPWAETKRRKPEKAEGGRLDRAKALYEQFRAINTPDALPEIG